MCSPPPAPERVRRQRARQTGVTLVELIVFIVIVAVGIAGILLVFNVATRASADPLMPKQALAIAEALLEEVQLAPFTWCDPNDANAETAASAAACATTPEGLGPEAGDARPFDNVSDYHGLVLNPITDVAGTPVAGLAGYAAAIAVATSALNTLADTGNATTADALRITVTVTAPNGQAYALEGYRTRYAPNALP